MSTEDRPWPSSRLADVAEIIRGVTYTKGDTQAEPRAGYLPLIRATNISSRIDLENGLVHIPEALVQPLQRLTPGDIIVVASSGSLTSVGRSALVGTTPEATFGAFCMNIRPNGRILPAFLAHLLKSEPVRRLWSENARGTNINNLKRGVIEDTPVPLPSMEDQRRIVDVLEDHLSRLDAGRDELGRAGTRVVNMAQSHLLRLVLGPAHIHLRTIDPRQLGQPDPPDLALPRGWNWRKWREVGTSQNGKAFPSADYTDQGVRLLRPGNLGPSGALTWADRSTRRLPERYAAEQASLLIEPRDIVMNLTAQSLKDDFLGRVCLVGVEDRALLNQRIARLQAQKIEPEFALLVLQSPVFRRYVRSLNSGSLIQHMFTKQVDQFWLPVPPEDYQRIAIESAARQREAAERLLCASRAAATRAATLDRALLTAAFSGKLIRSGAHLNRGKEVASV